MKTSAASADYEVDDEDEDDDDDNDDNFGEDPDEEEFYRKISDLNDVLNTQKNVILCHLLQELCIFSQMVLP